MAEKKNTVKMSIDDDDNNVQLNITEQSLESLMQSVSTILNEVGEDPNREGLLKTPLRVAKAYKFLTKGYDEDVDKLLNGAIFNEHYDEMVIVKDIDFYSLCEHHMLPFYGKCHIAYIPNGKIVGLSKIPRIVEMYSRRLQVQERMTREIGDMINKVLEPKGVAVVSEAKHLCMMMRGVEKQNSIATASCMLGRFKSDEKTRSEFLKLIGK
ncbi:MAG: GTP cyclohydrolase I FolE [Ignavibacteria bacterium]|nr:GTP cyclohydrolase I FolE [Ignavibacteria bacterium]